MISPSPPSSTSVIRWRVSSSPTARSAGSRRWRRAASAAATSWLVTPPMAEATTTQAASEAAIRPAARRMRAALPMLVPPNLWTSILRISGFYHAL